MIRLDLISLDDEKVAENSLGFMELGDYYIIHPGAYNILNEYFNLELENIITLNYDINEDNPYDGVGMMYFKENFDYVLDHFYNDNKKELYNWITRNKNEIFNNRIPFNDILSFHGELMSIIESTISLCIKKLSTCTDEKNKNYILLLIQKELNIKNQIVLDFVLEEKKKKPNLIPYTEFCERYRCECGKLTGLLEYHKNSTCKICNTKVKYRDIL